MATLWVVADQGREATGVFYKAYVTRLIAAVRPDGARPGVRLRYQDLSTFGYPERFAKEVAGHLGGFDGGRDRVLLVRYSEGADYESLRPQRRELCEAVAGELRVEVEKVHMTIVQPMSEALYLLDEGSTETLADWIDAHPGVSPRGGRREKAPSIRARDRTRALGTRRRLAPRRDGVSWPSKRELYDLLGDGLSKSDLARHMAALVEGPDWHPPGDGPYPELDRLTGFLRAWLAA